MTALSSGVSEPRPRGSDMKWRSERTSRRRRRRIMKVQGDIDEKRMGMVEGSSFSGRDRTIEHLWAR